MTSATPKPRAGEHPRMSMLFGNEVRKLDYFTPELRHRIITCVSALDGVKDVSLIASRVAANNQTREAEEERDDLKLHLKARIRELTTIRERERELVEALGWVVKSAPNTVDMRRLLEFSGLDDVTALQRKLDHWDYQLEQARKALAKHGR